MQRALSSILLCAAIAAGPALSQVRPSTAVEIAEQTMMIGDSNLAFRMEGAIAFCYTQWGAYEGHEQFLSDFGWSHAAWGGLHEYTKGPSQIIMSQDFFCDVSDATLTQQQARETLDLILKLDTTLVWEIGETEMGCPMWTSPAGRIVVSSDGQDPVCTPTEGSAIRFWMAGQS